MANIIDELCKVAGEPSVALQTRKDHSPEVKVEGNKMFSGGKQVSSKQVAEAAMRTGGKSVHADASKGKVAPVHALKEALKSKGLATKVQVRSGNGHASEFGKNW